MGNKISELEASVTEKDKRIKLLEAKLKRAKEEYEVKANKITQAAAETTVDLSIARVKIEDLKDEVNHARQLNENYRILAANYYTLGNRCYNELVKSFLLWELPLGRRFFVDGDLEGLMRWVNSCLQKCSLSARGLLHMDRRLMHRFGSAIGRAQSHEDLH
jgi:uncharacterized small protein (DUF1192 family)